MQIIIPMTGYGSRFVAAGYKELKPFIKVQGKPIIQWIVDGMYPDEENIMFVCRKEHLDSIEGMETELHRIAPTSKIYAIDDWVKKGPVYDVLRASDAIDDEKPAIINYCDFYMSWDWKKFKKKLSESDPDGCVPCYTGFHPHLMVQKNFYASCLTDEDDNLIEIREKYSFEKDKTKSKHSPGNYYFKSGAYLKKYCQMLVDSGQDINGEYYASMPYNFMVRDGLKVWVPTDIDYFCQWGTPEDMRESVYWLDMMRDMKR
jgi:NDP-sugar pyrophosphorylase family protein